MADNPDQRQPTPTTAETNPVVAFFSNFLKLFNLPLNFPPPATDKTQQVEEEKKNYSAISDTTEVAVQSKKPSIVRYPPPAQEDSFPSLKIEGDEFQERESNPNTLWQVYALGGVLVLSWAWRKWNERKGSKKTPEEDPPTPE